MGINVWLVEKTDEDGYDSFVDICETFDEAVEAVFTDWESNYVETIPTWLTEPFPNGYADAGRGWYIYEFRPTTTFAGLISDSRVSYEYYIFNFIKE